MIASDKTFVPFNPFVQMALTDYLKPCDSILHLDSASGAMALAKALGDECYTHLALGSASSCFHEIVRIECINGQFAITRAVCESTPRPLFFSPGDYAMFTWCPEGILALKDQCEPEPDGEEVDCGYTGVMSQGRYDYHFKNGFLEKRECNNRPLPQGYVHDPVLCFNKDGELIEAAQGSGASVLHACS